MQRSTSNAKRTRQIKMSTMTRGDNQKRKEDGASMLISTQYYSERLSHRPQKCSSPVTHFRNKSKRGPPSNENLSPTVASPCQAKEVSCFNTLTPFVPFPSPSYNSIRPPFQTCFHIFRHQHISPPCFMPRIPRLSCRGAASTWRNSSR